MKREGPCRHCGIAYTPLWRSGPREKPVLCNACGSRWRIRGTLVDYVPKHGTKETRGRKPKYRIKVPEPDICSVRVEDDTTNRSSSGSTSSSEICIPTRNTNVSDDLKIWNKESIPRRKRSVLRQSVLSPVERLHKDLLHIKYQQELLKQSVEEDVLIYDSTNLFSTTTETAHGAILLKSPNTATNESKPVSPLPEYKTSCSTNTSLEQSSLKSIPLSNHVPQKYEYSSYKHTRGRTSGNINSSGPIFSHSRAANELEEHICARLTKDQWNLESSGQWKDIYIHSLHPAEVGAAFPNARNRSLQVQHNQAVQGTNREPSRAFNVQKPLDFPILESSSSAINPTSLFSPIGDFSCNTHFKAVEQAELLANNLRKLCLGDSNAERGNQPAALDSKLDGPIVEEDSQLVGIPLFSDLDQYINGMD